MFWFHCPCTCVTCHFGGTTLCFRFTRFKLFHLTLIRYRVLRSENWQHFMGSHDGWPRCDQCCQFSPALYVEPCELRGGVISTLLPTLVVSNGARREGPSFTRQSSDPDPTRVSTRPDPVLSQTWTPHQSAVSILISSHATPGRLNKRKSGSCTGNCGKKM